MSDSSQRQDFLSQLLEVRRAEKSTDRMTEIPLDFWLNVQKLLSVAYSDLMEETSHSPLSRKGDELRLHYQRMKNTTMDILDWRLEKIARQAAGFANIGSPPLNLLPDEMLLFDKLVKTLQEFRAFASPHSTT